VDTTDVWFRTYRVPADLRFSYGFIVDSAAALVGRDTLNPRVLPDGVGLLGPSVVELPKAPAQRWIIRDSTVPQGKLEALDVHSRVLGADRRAWIHLPANYDPRRPTPYHLLVCFDGEWFAKANDLPISLDNLVASQEVPPFIAVFVEQSAQPRRNVELGNNQEFLDFVANELLPAVRARWHATTQPAATAACGGSSGGLGSAFAAYRRPDVFGNVISESGAFWPGNTRDDLAREWLTKQIEVSPKLPIRFVLHVGVVEVHPTVGGGPSILTTNRHLRDVLIAKGYELHYSEVAGGHEPLSWRGGLADGLIELFGRSNAK
jgi:enterochelin esterase family protein